MYPTPSHRSSPRRKTVSAGDERRDPGARGFVRRVAGEDGVALVSVLIVLFGVTVLATAGFVTARADYQINENHWASARAFNASDEGMYNHLGRGKLGLDTTTYNASARSADVWYEPLLMVDDSSSIYRLRSFGQHTPSRAGLATRTTSTIVLHKAAGLSVNAAMTTPAGLQKNGIAGLVSGFDLATSTDCSVGGTEDVAGLQVPPGGLTQSGSGKGGGGSGFQGTPPVDDTQTPAQIFAGLGITAGMWQGMLNGNYAVADYIISVDGWPDFKTIDPNYWPMIVADVPSFAVDNTHDGHGALIAEGDLTVNGGWNWDGVVLVGGKYVSNGIELVNGAVIAGLNLLLGQPVGKSDLGNGNWKYNYDSCNVMNALKGIGWPVEEPGTWFEEF